VYTRSATILPVCAMTVHETLPNSRAASTTLDRQNDRTGLESYHCTCGSEAG